MPALAREVDGLDEGIPLNGSMDVRAVVEYRYVLYLYLPLNSDEEEEAVARRLRIVDGSILIPRLCGRCGLVLV